MYTVVRSVGPRVSYFAAALMLICRLFLLSVLLAALLPVYFLEDFSLLATAANPSLWLIVIDTDIPGSKLVAGSLTLKMCNGTHSFQAKDTNVRPFQTWST